MLFTVYNMPAKAGEDYKVPGSKKVLFFLMNEKNGPYLWAAFL
jgi:hypothetical protein